MDVGKIVKTKQILDGTVVASASAISEVIDIRNAVGYFSLQINLTGTGTAKFEYYCSNDGINYVLGGTIASSVTAGNTLEEFSPPICRWMKIKTTETGGANSVVVDSILAKQ